MSDHVTEEEQVEAIKRWWKEYGLATITGIIIAIAVVVGWQYYTRFEAGKKTNASLIYQNMLVSFQKGDTAQGEERAKMLMQSYSTSSYADFAAFWLAKMAVEKQAFSEAATKLRWVVQRSSHEGLKQLAKIRLARVEMALHQPSQALNTLSQVSGKDYVPMASEVKGDLYRAEGQLSQARQAYQEALGGLPKSAPIYHFIQTKLANLPTN